MLRVITEDMPEKLREMLVNQRDMFGLTPVYLSLQRCACCFLDGEAQSVPAAGSLGQAPPASTASRACGTRALRRGEESRAAFEFLMKAGAKYNCQLRPGQGQRAETPSASGALQAE